MNFVKSSLSFMAKNQLDKILDIKEFPINMETILKKLNIKILYHNNKHKYSFIEKYDKNIIFNIFDNDEKYSNNFAIAKLLGYYLIMKNEEFYYDYIINNEILIKAYCHRIGYNEIDFETYHFALNFLMPKHKF